MPASNPAAGPPSRRIGDGWEPHVDEVGDELTYSIPVASGIVDGSFSFSITGDDLAVLLAEPYRRLVLQHSLHTLLQRTMMRGGDPSMTQQGFREVADLVLAAPVDEVERFIDRVDAANNIALRVFVDRDLERLASDG